MRRRDFLKAVTGAISSPGADAGNQEREGFAAWTWVHGGQDVDATGWRQRFERVRRAGVRGVLVGGGDTAMLAGVAHEVGLRFHRWTWILNRNGDRWVQDNHPEWFTVSRDGESSLAKPPYVDDDRWLCPSRSGVRAYLREEVARVASEPGVDAVHLDYIRHCDVILPRGLRATYGLVQDRELPEFDFCYCEACRDAFSRQDGRDPLEIPDPTADEAWRRFRWDGVTGLVEVLARTVHDRGKELSAAVFPTPSLARRLARQAWDEWPVNHYVPALGAFDLGRAVAAARRGGASGVALFEMDGLTDDHLTALAEALVVRAEPPQGRVRGAPGGLPGTGPMGG